MTYDSGSFYRDFNARIAERLREENRRDQEQEQDAINKTYANLEAGQPVGVASKPLDKLNPPYVKFDDTETLEEIAG